MSNARIIQLYLEFTPNEAYELSDAIHALIGDKERKQSTYTLIRALKQLVQTLDDTIEGQ